MTGVTGKVKPPAADGRSARWDAHREERRAELTAAAVRAIDQHGPEAGIADIAAEAGVSKPVIYRYFASKTELHAAVGRWGAALVLERMAAVWPSAVPDRQDLEAVIGAYVEVLEEHPQVFLLLVRHRTQDHDPLADGRTEVSAAFARMIGDGLRARGVDAAGAELWAQGLLGLGLSVGEWWLTRRTMSRAAVVDYLTGFVWHAFAGTAAEHGLALAPPTPIRRRTR